MRARALAVKACGVDRAVEIGEQLQRILGARLLKGLDRG
jgi:hypothetical protein